MTISLSFHLLLYVQLFSVSFQDFDIKLHDLLVPGHHPEGLVHIHNGIFILHYSPKDQILLTIKLTAKLIGKISLIRNIASDLSVSVRCRAAHNDIPVSVKKTLLRKIVYLGILAFRSPMRRIFVFLESDALTCSR